MKANLDRRLVLRGMLAGSAVTVGLPYLDCQLNGNGDAIAATRARIPLRFGTWFWGLGLNEGEWQPKQTGTNYELSRQLIALKPHQKKMNLFSGGQVFLDGASNNTHFTGVQGIMTGKVTGNAEYLGTIDTLIGDVIGTGTRFRSLDVSCDGDPKACWSARKDSGKQPAEVSPIALYARVFGPEFQDPNAAVFKPDPSVMIRRSALSAVAEERSALMGRLGAADKAKLDNYFTSLRSLEQKLEIQLQKPEPLEACSKPGEPDDKEPLSTLATVAMARHDVFASLIAHALACGQTRVFNLSITQGMSGLRKEGEPSSHHTYTHEEPIDSAVGYQVKCDWFSMLYMQGLANFAATLDGIQEGDRTMLDRMMLLAFTDHGAPRLHSLRNYPFMTFGAADGRMKTGMHIAAPGDAATRVGLTVQQIMGVPVSAWGVGSNRVSRPYSEVFV